MIFAKLQALGLNEGEAKIYQLINKIGPSPASTLARVCNINRTSAYDILDKLIKRNFIIKIQKGVNTFYAIDDLNKIWHQKTEELYIARDLVTHLRKDQNKDSDVLVNYYIGVEGYKQMYDDIFKNNPKEIMVWVNLDNFWKALDPVYEENWTLERVRRKMYARLLMQDTPLARAFKAQDHERNRETRIIEKRNMFHTTCFLYDNRINYFDSSGRTTGIRITHPGFYDMEKNIFEMAWDNSKDRCTKTQ